MSLFVVWQSKESLVRKFATRNSDPRKVSSLLTGCFIPSSCIINIAAISLFKNHLPQNKSQPSHDVSGPLGVFICPSFSLPEWTPCSLHLSFHPSDTVLVLLNKRGTFPQKSSSNIHPLSLLPCLSQMSVSYTQRPAHEP